MPIHDPEALHTLLDEIAQWDLQARRQYLVDLERGLGRDAANQVKDGLRELWNNRSQQ